MRTLKFRGRVPDNQGIEPGKIVCGSLLDYGEGTANCPQFWIRPPAAERNYPVEPESIAQFIGYDSNGAEIYEGDIVVLNDPEYKIEYTARLQGCATAVNGCFISNFGKVSLKVDEEESS